MSDSVKSLSEVKILESTGYWYPLLCPHLLSQSFHCTRWSVDWSSTNDGTITTTLDELLVHVAYRITCFIRFQGWVLWVYFTSSKIGASFSFFPSSDTFLSHNDCAKITKWSCNDSFSMSSVRILWSSSNMKLKYILWSLGKSSGT